MFGKFMNIAVVGLVAVLWLARPSAGSGPERVYVVKPADTLWSIATRHYAGDPREGIWKLRERNDLDASVLRPGQRLVLPPA
jgi:LysM repeat protein